MARIVISSVFADGDEVHVTVAAPSPSPDLLDDMRRQALDAWTDAVAYAIAVQSPEVGEQ